MAQITDQLLPFTEQRGQVYIAPLGAAIAPQHYVSQGRFTDIWPDGWLLGGETNPKRCSESVGYDAGTLPVWTLGVDLLPTERTPWTSLAPLPPGQESAAPRFMLGWQSTDRRSRIIARQVTIAKTQAGKDALFLTYQLERARMHDEPDTRPRWRRLLDRLLRRHLVTQPRFYPPFALYTAR